MRFSHEVVINTSREENGRTIELTETITKRAYPSEFSGSCPSSHATNNIPHKFIPLGDTTTQSE